MLIENSEFTAVGPKSVPVWNIVAPGGVNANTFFRCTLNALHDVDDYFLHLEVTDAGRYAYDHAFRDLIFESTNGGEIRLLSHNSTLIENCHGYDYHLRGDIYNDLILVERSETGNPSENVMIINSGRRGGLLAEGVYDLRVGDAKSTLVDNMSVVPRTSLRIHTGITRTTRLHNVHADASISGYPGPVTTNDGGPAPRKLAADASLGFQHSLVFADSSSGDLKLTLPDGVFAKGYQIVKQGEANRVVLVTFDNSNRFEDDSTSFELVEHGEAICTATVGDRRSRFVPCILPHAGGLE